MHGGAVSMNIRAGRRQRTYAERLRRRDRHTWGLRAEDADSTPSPAGPLNGTAIGDQDASPRAPVAADQSVMIGAMASSSRTRASSPRLHSTRTGADLVALGSARSDWYRAIRSQGWVVFSIATTTFVALELMGNEQGVNAAWSSLFSAKGRRPFDLWNIESGLKLENVVVADTAIAVAVIALTVAVVAAPRVGAERTMTDRVALAYWGQFAPRISAFLAGVALGLSVPLAHQEPGTVALLLFINVPLCCLAIVTVQRIYDRRAVLMAELEKEEAPHALSWLDTTLPERRSPWSVWFNFYWVVLLCSAGSVALLLLILEARLVDYRVPAPTFGDILYVIWVTVFVAWLAGIGLAPSFLCCCWWWRSRAYSRPRQAQLALTFFLLVPLLWAALGFVLMHLTGGTADSSVWLADIIWSGRTGIAFYWLRWAVVYLEARSNLQCGVFRTGGGSFGFESCAGGDSTPFCCSHSARR